MVFHCKAPPGSGTYGIEVRPNAKTLKTHRKMNLFWEGRSGVDELQGGGGSLRAGGEEALDRSLAKTI